MGMSGQSSNAASQSFQEGQSRGESASKSVFGTDQASLSRGQSGSTSTGESASQGFGFSGLNPVDSSGISSALANQIVNQVFPSLTSAATAEYNLPSLDSRGLYPAQAEAANQATREALSTISGRLAGQGQLRPENISNVAGQAVQNILPQLMPVISENIKTAAGAPLALAQGRAASVAQLLSAFPGLLGSQNQQQATSRQQAQSASEQISEALTKTFGETVSRSLQEAFSKGEGSSGSGGFGFGLNLGPLLGGGGGD